MKNIFKKTLEDYWNLKLDSKIKFKTLKSELFPFWKWKCENRKFSYFSTETRKVIKFKIFYHFRIIIHKFSAPINLSDFLWLYEFLNFSRMKNNQNLFFHRLMTCQGFEALSQAEIVNIEKKVGNSMKI